MKIELNARGNGACPLCERLNDCAIRAVLNRALEPLSDPTGEGMEAVVYNCPQFLEKDEP